jgi:hypothetical protein
MPHRVDCPMLVRPGERVEFIAAEKKEESAMSNEQRAMSAQDAIAHECDAVKGMLLAKNRAYGNSAMEPVRVFSKADAVEQIRVRIDDKLSRLARGSAAGEDVTLDLIGYLVLLRIAERREDTSNEQRAMSNE